MQYRWKEHLLSFSIRHQNTFNRGNMKTRQQSVHCSLASKHWLCAPQFLLSKLQWCCSEATSNSALIAIYYVTRCYGEARRTTHGYEEDEKDNTNAVFLILIVLVLCMPAYPYHEFLLTYSAVCHPWQVALESVIRETAFELLCSGTYMEYISDLISAWRMAWLFLLYAVRHSFHPRQSVCHTVN